MSEITCLIIIIDKEHSNFLKSFIFFWLKMDQSLQSLSSKSKLIVYLHTKLNLKKLVFFVLKKKKIKKFLNFNEKENWT